MMSNENQNQNSAVIATTATTPPADTSIIRDDDILEINAGGKIITTRRSTLTLVPNSLFSSMFSGRWSLELDSNGRIFLDEDPEFIESIINFLRNKKREDPSNQVQSTPKVRKEKKDDFISLLGYYGLKDFFNPPPIVLPLDINNIDVINPNGSNIIVTRSENKIQFYNITSMYHFVACKPALDSTGAGSFWKVTVDRSTESGNIFLGIIGNLNANSINSFIDPTFYGWAGNHVFFGGKIKNEDSGWTGFTQGECLYFHLISNKLTMFSVQKNRKLIIDNIPTTVDEYYIHFNMYWPGEKLTLEPLNEEECATFLQKLDEIDDDDTVL